LRYPASETAEKHKRVLDEAARLIRDRGFDGVSIPEIMNAAGLTHGSFYNHFASKSALASDCILHSAQKSLANMGGVESTAGGKKAYIDHYLSVAHRDDPGSGCMMSALGSEVRREPAARHAMTIFVKTFIAKFASHFPWPARTTARSASIRATAALVGGLILARAVDDEELSAEILLEVADGLRNPVRRK
jgi:TetR/AcrR family transcriptional regulator, transcriptional repressor for nem operon